MKARAGTPTGFEVHEHAIIRGPRSNRSGNWPAGMGSNFVHSHEGGNVPHQHPDTGPACFTVDKDDWARATGLKGGGRKKFTVTTTGEQFPVVELEDWQRTFEVHVDEESCRRALAGTESTGAGVGPAARMILGFGMRPVFPGRGDDTDGAA